MPPQSYEELKLSEDAGVGMWGAVSAIAPPFSWAQEPQFFQSIVPVCEFHKGSLKGIKLVPLELGFGEPHSQRGRPILARPKVADEIFVWLRDVSKPFGTEIGDGFVQF